MKISTVKNQNMHCYSKFKAPVCVLLQMLLLSFFLSYVSSSEAREQISPFERNYNRIKNTEKAVLGKQIFNKAGDFTLEVNILDSLAVLKTEARFAGAVSSLVFRGQEYINSDDNGRELQSSIFLDEFGACYNPTEAGGAYDKGLRSSSKLLYAATEGNTIKTGVDMAYWLAPQQKFSKGQCGTHTGIYTAQNNTILSGYLLHKKVTVGMPGFPNVIDYSVAFDVPQKHTTAMFEVVTGYMPKNFDQFYRYNQLNNAFNSVDMSSGQSKYPVVAATGDKKHAMAVYSQGLPQGNLGYAYIKHKNTNKWNCTYRAKNIDKGRYYFHAYIVFGTLEEVESTLRNLVKKYPYRPYKMSAKQEGNFPF